MIILTNFKNIGGNNVKALIGFANFFVFMAIGLALASYTGYFLMIVPPYILFIVCTNYFCKKWDRYVVYRAAKKKNLSLFDSIKNSLPEYIIHHCNRFRGNESALKKFLKECVGRELLSKAYADIVFEEYIVEKDSTPLERQNPENTYRNF